MWPRQKILLVIPPGIEEWQGILSLLEALHKDVIIRNASKDISMDLTHLTFPKMDQESEELSEGGPTEILYWPEVSLEDGCRRWGSAYGLEQYKLPEFLHNYWEEDILLPVDQQCLADGEPLLWRFLESSGFEPSLLWKNSEGRWVTRLGGGLHWVISEDLYNICCGERDSLGKKPRWIDPTCYWTLNEDRVDFYSSRESYSFLGSIERIETTAKEIKISEQAIYNTVLQALRLGVPWRNIQNVVKEVFKSPRDDIVDKEKSLRWYVNAFERDAWPGGTELPSEEFEHLEGRGIS
jgi:hypothetical protein